MDDSRIFIVGANGQLGQALQAQYPNAQKADITELDITDHASVHNYDWTGIDVIINAAAYTNVDGAETEEGRRTAWKVNAVAVANLSTVATTNHMTLVHISSDYVFDGTNSPHTEEEIFAPLSVYGASKAAGDIAVAMTPKYYILRTSWVIGEGKNFVRTMLHLGKKDVNPTVVSDQIGRLTFTTEIVRAIDHLLTNRLEFDTYNVTNDGPAMSWADITREIYLMAGLPNTVTDTTTAEYYAGKENIAPRPLLSELSLDRLHSTGFASRDWREDLKAYIEAERESTE